MCEMALNESKKHTAGTEGTLYLMPTLMGLTLYS